MAPEDIKLDSPEDIVDYVKQNNLFAMVAIGLNDDFALTRVFQFQYTDVPFPEAVTRCCVSFINGMEKIFGHDLAMKILAESFKMHMTMEEHYKDVQLQ